MGHLMNKNVLKLEYFYPIYKKNLLKKKKKITVLVIYSGKPY